MSRNNEKNIRKHNNKLQRTGVKNAEILRKEKLKQIMKKFYDSNNLENN
jgi:hypothetical protein